MCWYYTAEVFKYFCLLSYNTQLFSFILSVVSTLFAFVLTRSLLSIYGLPFVFLKMKAKSFSLNAFFLVLVFFVKLVILEIFVFPKAFVHLQYIYILFIISFNLLFLHLVFRFLISQIFFLHFFFYFLILLILFTFLCFLLLNLYELLYFDNQ